MFEELEEATRKRIKREQELEQVIIRLVKEQYRLMLMPVYKNLSPELEGLIIGGDE